LSPVSTGIGDLGWWFTILVYIQAVRPLSLAILPWVGAMRTGDGFGYRLGRNGEFCTTVGPVPGLLSAGILHVYCVIG